MINLPLPPRKFKTNRLKFTFSIYSLLFINSLTLSWADIYQLHIRGDHCNSLECALHQAIKDALESDGQKNKTGSFNLANTNNDNNFSLPLVVLEKNNSSKKNASKTIDINDHTSGSLTIDGPNKYHIEFTSKDLTNGKSYKKRSSPTSPKNDSRLINNPVKAAIENLVFLDDKEQYINIHEIVPKNYKKKYSNKSNSNSRKSSSQILLIDENVFQKPIYKENLQTFIEESVINGTSYQEKLQELISEGAISEALDQEHVQQLIDKGVIESASTSSVHLINRSGKKNSPHGIIYDPKKSSSSKKGTSIYIIHRSEKEDPPEDNFKNPNTPNDPNDPDDPDNGSSNNDYIEEFVYMLGYFKIILRLFPDSNKTQIALIDERLSLRINDGNSGEMAKYLDTVVMTPIKKITKADKIDPINIQKAKEIGQKSKEVSPKAKDNSPKAKDPSPKTKDVTPKAKDPSPKTKDATPKAKDPSPKTKDASPKVQDSSPKVKDPSPKVEDTNQNNEDVEQNIEDLNQNAEDTVQIKEDDYQDNEDVHQDDQDAEEDTEQSTKNNKKEKSVKKRVADMLNEDIEHVREILVNLPTKEALASALNLLHPAKIADVDLIISNNHSLIYSNICRHFEESKCCIKTDNLLNVWGKAFGNVQTISTSGSSTGYHARTGGIFVGVDYCPLDTICLGGGFAFTNDSVKWYNKEADALLNTYYGFLYSSLNYELYFLEAIGSLSYTCVDGTRYIRASSELHRSASHENHAFTFSGRVKGGFNFNLPCAIKFQVFGATDLGNVRNQSFTERGAYALNLHIHKRNSTHFRGEAGLQFSRQFFSNQNTCWTPTIGLKWVYQNPISGNRVNANFQHQSSRFSVKTRSKVTNQISPVASLTANSSDGVYLSAYYEGAFGDGWNSNEFGVHLGKTY